MSRAVTRPDTVRYEADEIAIFASEQNADLIVCGAYGHSRMRELLLGGTTNDLLGASPICCLMSH